jgi:protease-4
VIYAVGEIKDGKGNDQIIGGNSTAEDIRKARLDTSIKAIVLRVNSPGGSALASDVIWREVVLARKVKPVIASMGNYAASGGYYISCAADSIVAENTTITGSIGVFGLMFNAQKMFNNKLGITFDTVNTGHFSGLGSMSRPLRADEKQLMQAEIERIYDGFITKVAEGRRMTKAMVDSLGQGRVWNGAQALQIGLVDKEGNLNDAVEMAARMSKLNSYRVVELPKQKELLEQIMEDFSTSARAYIAKGELGPQYRYYKTIQEVVNSQGILARMPFNLELY